MPITGQSRAEDLFTGARDLSTALRPDGVGGVEFRDVEHGELIGIGVDDHHTRYTDIEARTAVVDDTAYGPSWNSDTTHAASRNALYDKIQSLGPGTCDYADGGEGVGANRTLGNTDYFDLGFLTNGLTRLRIQASGLIETVGVDLALYGGDLLTDRWLFSATNTLVGVDVACAGNLTHGSGTQGWYNTAMGYLTLNSITTGSFNNALGTYALYDLTSGIGNNAIGYRALHNVTIGNYNVAIGSLALSSLTQGSYNIAIGAYDVLLNVTTGSRNIVLGDDTGNDLVSGSRNILIGDRLIAGGAAANDVLNIGNAIKGDLSVGDVTITRHLSVDNGAELRLWDIGSSHYIAHKAPTLTGNVTLTWPANDGSANQVLSTDGAGILSWATGGAGGGDFSDGGEAGGAARTLGNTDNYSLGFLTNNQSRLHIQNDGCVGIGTIMPSSQLHVLVEDAATATSLDTFTVEHASTGVTADGFGASILFALEDEADVILDAGRLGFDWHQNTDEMSQFTVWTHSQWRGTYIRAVLAADSMSLGVFNGNKRGKGATDLQGMRDADTQVASGIGSTIAGGGLCTASGNYSYATGYDCTADGAHTFAIGYRAKAGGLDGVFVWADQTAADFTADRANQVAFRCSGGFKIVDNNGYPFEFLGNELRFYEAANYVGFKAPALSANKIWTLPNADGNTDDHLKTDGAGNLGWVAPPAAAVGVPSGGIILWSGTIANIPSGYVICDGNNSTPNLLDKFVKGVPTAATNPGTTGGESTHVLTVAELASHYHNLSKLSTSTGYALSQYDGNAPTSSRKTSSAGSNSAHENEPAFYEVAFIMKT